MDNGDDVHETNASIPRQLGTAEGDFVVPDDFDAPLPDRILDEFKA